MITVKQLTDSADKGKFVAIDEHGVYLCIRPTRRAALAEGKILADPQAKSARDRAARRDFIAKLFDE